MRKKKAFTLMETVVVVIIVGILATLGLTQYSGFKEKAADKAAIEDLKLIKAASRVYRMETGSYYPGAAAVTDIPTINANLKLDLSNQANRLWNYSISSSANNICAQATRTTGTVRYWSYTVTDTDDPDPDNNCSP